MIKSIGYNKALIIALLVIFAVLSFLYMTNVLAPNLQKQERKLSANRAEISEMTNNLTKLSEGLEKFEKQKNDFKAVQQLGFFDPQNRVSAKQRIVAIQKESRLLSAKYIIKPAVSISNEKAQKVGYKILNTDIDFNLEAIDDADIYKFIYILNYGFPGQVIINKFSMSREKEITQPLLRRIGVGQAEPIIEANLSVSWQTMVPDETISVSNEDGGSAK